MEGYIARRLEAYRSGTTAASATPLRREIERVQLGRAGWTLVPQVPFAASAPGAGSTVDARASKPCSIAIVAGGLAEAVPPAHVIGGGGPAAGFLGECRRRSGISPWGALVHPRRLQ
jgi:hypothetical protein